MEHKWYSDFLFIIKRQRGQLFSVSCEVGHLAVAFLLIIFCLSIGNRILNGEMYYEETSMLVATGINIQEASGDAYNFSEEHILKLKNKKEVDDYRIIYDSIDAKVEGLGKIKTQNLNTEIYPFEVSDSFLLDGNNEKKINSSGALVTEEVFRSVPITRSQLLNSNLTISHNGKTYYIPITGILEKDAMDQMELPSQVSIFVPKRVVEEMKIVKVNRISCLMNNRGDFLDQVKEWQESGRKVYFQTESMEVNAFIKYSILVGCFFGIILVTLYISLGVKSMMKLRDSNQKEFLNMLYSFGFENQDIKKIYVQDAIIIGAGGVIAGTILLLLVSTLGIFNMKGGNQIISVSLVSYLVTVVLVLGEQVICSIKNYHNVRGWRMV